MFEYYLREFKGFGQNGDEISNNQRYLKKSPIPSVNTSFSIEARYKRFSISSLLYGQFGHYLYNNTSNAFLTKANLANGGNVTEEIVASSEAPSNFASASTRFLEKGDFIRLQ